MIHLKENLNMQRQKALPYGNLYNLQDIVIPLCQSGPKISLKVNYLNTRVTLYLTSV